LALPDRFPSVVLDAFVVMPNHVHGIIVFRTEPEPTIGSAQQAAPGGVVQTGDESARRPSLGAVMRAFKSLSAIAANRALGRTGAPFWQPNDHERVIRDDDELEWVRWYIAENPANWHRDAENVLVED
jgi:REP element-mobilizing transposase RayT